MLVTKYRTINTISGESANIPFFISVRFCVPVVFKCKITQIL